MRELKIEKEHMEEYAQNLVMKSMSDGDIFKLVRKLQADAVDQDVIVTNCGAIYWYFIEYKQQIPDK